MKAVLLTMMLAGLGLLYACGDADVTPETPIFKADVAGETWDLGVKRVVYARYDPMHKIYTSYYTGDSVAGKQLVVAIWEDRLNQSYTYANAPYTANPDFGMYGGVHISLVGYGGNNFYSTRQCDNQSYKVDIVKLDKKKKCIRIKFEGKLCGENGTDSVRVTNGECWAIYE